MENFIKLSATFVDESDHQLDINGLVLQMLKTFPFQKHSMNPVQTVHHLSTRLIHMKQIYGRYVLPIIRNESHQNSYATLRSLRRQYFQANLNYNLL